MLTYVNTNCECLYCCVGIQLLLEISNKFTIHHHTKSTHYKEHMHNHMNSATLYNTTDSCEILSEHGTSLLKIPLLLYHNTCVGFAEARPIDVETSSLVVLCRQPMRLCLGRKPSYISSIVGSS